MKKYNIRKKLIPQRILTREKKIYKIIEVDKPFIINEYDVITDKNDYIKELLLYSKHPNCDPASGRFCLPEEIIGKKFNTFTKRLIEEMLIVYNLRDAYFSPWLNLKWKENIPITFNKQKAKTLKEEMCSAALDSIKGVKKVWQQLNYKK